MRSETTKDLSIHLDDLKNAIHQEQIFLHYQPQINIKSKKVVGTEAFVRWHHQTHGLIHAKDFIELAEENNLIVALTECALKEMARGAKKWCDIESDLRTSINLSIMPHPNTKFPDRIGMMVESCGLDTSKITIEFMDSQIILNDSRYVTVLSELKDVGFGLSICGFGSENFDEKHFKNFPFDEIKINQNSFPLIRENADKQHIFDECLSLGHREGVRFVAENIESQEDQDFILEKGIDILQGYYVAKPMPLEIALNWLQIYQDE